MLPWIAALSLLLLAGPAAAHHPMGGAIPATLVQGLLSGLGHPVIGIDHLAFILGAALLGARDAQGFRLPLGFAAASVAGTALSLAVWGVPAAAELAVALSLLALAGLLVIAAPARLGVLLAVAAGLAHGTALAEAVIGAEATPIGAYLMGLAVSQGAVGVLAWVTLRRALGGRWLRPALLNGVAASLLAALGAVGLAMA